MANPIIQSTGSVSGAGTAGQGRSDLVPGETVTLSDTEALNSGATYFWEFDDTPIGTSPTMLTPTAASASFVVPADPLLAGSYRVRCTVDGSFVSVEVIAVPLANTGARIPSFEEETQYDGAGNMKGWHEAQTNFMRVVDQTLGDLGASSIERSAAVVVPNGGSSTEVELGSAVYPGSALAIAVRGEAALTGGSVDVSMRVNGVTRFTATMNTGSPITASSIQLPGAYPLVSGDRVSVLVVGTALTTSGATPLPLAINVVMTNTLLTDILTIPDAGLVQKGLVKLSVAPVVAIEPIAAGTNDGRIPTQDENDALAGTSGVPSAVNAYVTNQDPRNTDTRTPTSHALAGGSHSSSTLADLNAKISDTDVVDTLDPRIPTQGENDALVGTSGVVGAGNKYVTEADARLPTQDENNALVGTSGVVGTGNKYVTDADARNADSRTPLAHDLSGALHNSTTLANLNLKVSDADLAAIDVSQQYTKNQRSAVVALTDAASIATDLDLGNIFEVTLTASRTLANPTNIVKGMTWQVIVNQNGTGGWTLAYGGFYDWGDEGAPVVSSAANKTTILSFLALSTTQIAGTALKGFT